MKASSRALWCRRYISMTPNNGHRRLRFTRKVVRTLTSDVLIEAYEKAHLYKYLVDEGLIAVGPATAAKNRKQHAVLRAELLARGHDAETIDLPPTIPPALQVELDAAKEVADAPTQT